MPLKEVAPIEVPVDKPSTVNDQTDDALMQIGRFGDGRIKKMEIDYTAQVDKEIPEANLKARVRAQNNYSPHENWLCQLPTDK
jgi:hypothetical protein